MKSLLMKISAAVVVGPLLSIPVCHAAPDDAAPTRVELSVADKAPGQADDIARFKALAGGVGWEFTQTPETEAGLKRVGIKTIRCINVDIAPGEFAEDGSYRITGKPYRLDAHLETCRRVGARPHIIIGERAPEPLRVSVEQVEEQLSVLGQQPNRRQHYWNGDWPRMRAFWKALFKHVLIDKQATNARFEVGNEPDINGQFPRLAGKEGPMGSKALYEMYYDVYKNMTLAAEEFEKEHPGMRVEVGGPALAWAYTERFGDFRWLERFLADSSRDRLRLDFIGVHFYGNITSLHGEYPAHYPSFIEMLASAQKNRDKYHPGTPIILSEWGPSYHVNQTPEAMINANHVGAAWSAAFLKTILERGVDEAFFLVTTDLVRPNATTKEKENIWGWGSFFLNPEIYQTPWPKAPYHVIDMVSRMVGQRLPVTGAREGVDAIVSVDPDKKKATVLMWNYAAVLPEGKPPTELGRDAVVSLPLGTLRKQLRLEMRPLRIKTWMVSETLSNAHTLHVTEGKVDERSQLQLIENKELRGNSDSHELAMPACSVAFMEISLP